MHLKNLDLEIVRVRKWQNHLTIVTASTVERQQLVVNLSASVYVCD